MTTFAAIVEDVSLLSIDEIEELDNIINKLLIERRREEIAKNVDEAKEDLLKGELKTYTKSGEAIQYLKNL